MKHRMSYLKEYDKERFKIINESKLNKEQLEAIVLECVVKIEEETGRGTMKIQRKKPDTYVAKKNDNFPPNPRTDKSLYTWQRKGSPERMPPGRGSPPMNPRYDRNFDRGEGDIYDRNFDRGEGDKYKDSYPEENDRYSRRSPPHMARNNDYDDYDSSKDYERRVRPTNSSSSQLRQPGTSSNANDSDLRKVLEQKRSNESNVTDEALSIISALPTVSFFQLVLFKLDSIDIENEMELKFLERIVNKSTSMLVKANSQKFTPTLVEKFQESVKKTNLELASASTSETTAKMRDLMRLVENYKAQTRPATIPIESRQESIAYTPQRQVQEATSYSKMQPSYSSMQQTIDSTRVNFTSVNSIPFCNSSGQSTANFTPGFSSYSSNTVSIPGLTLTQNSDPTEDFSPFKELEAKAKSIFGVSQWSSNNAKAPAYTQRNPPY